MTESLVGSEFQARLQRLDELLRAVDRFADPAARSHTREIVQAVLDIHGAGLERLLEHVAEAGEAGDAILDACARDDVVAGLLLLHGLHPLELEARVRQALDEVRRSVGEVELIGVSEDGVVRVRAGGGCNGCASSAAAMRQAIESAIVARAPEAGGVEIEGLPEPEPGRGSRIPLPVF